MAATAPAERRQRWVRRARPLLGTLVEVAICGGDDAATLRLSRLAFDMLAAYHAAMSFHEATSDVRAIAAAAAGTTLELQPATASVLRVALALEAETGGVFNVAVGGELVARGRLPEPGGRPAGLASSASAALQVHATQPRLLVLQPVWVDLGGIAKGAAVDAALAVLREAGATAAVVNAGGDLATFGESEQTIRVPAPGSRRGFVEAGRLRDGAIATSAPLDADGDIPGALGSALVRPPGHDAGASWADRSVSVVAPSCCLADAATKVVALLGRGSATFLARHGARGFSVDAEGRLEHVA